MMFLSQVLEHSIIQANVVIFKEGVALVPLQVDAEAWELLKSHRMEGATTSSNATRV